MFTGLIEEIGGVRSIDSFGDSDRITIACSKVLNGTKHGDSIQVNGVCLTVIDQGEDFFSADVMKQTLKMSTLGDLTVGSSVNLERAALATTRLGGHIVQGHVDRVASVVSVSPSENWSVIRFAIDRDLSKMLVAQGSVTVQGVSLTVSNISEPEAPEQWFEVSLIPETLSATTLGSLSVGNRVNVETDVIARHVARMLSFVDSQAGGK